MSEPKLLVLLDGSEPSPILVHSLDYLDAKIDGISLVVLCDPAAATTLSDRRYKNKISWISAGTHFISTQSITDLILTQPSDRVAYLPGVIPINENCLRQLLSIPPKDSIAFIPPPVTSDFWKPHQNPITTIGWIAPQPMALNILSHLTNSSSRRLSDPLPILHSEILGIKFCAAPIHACHAFSPSFSAGQASKSFHVDVCAIVPHFDCEHLLPHCLESLANQTRPLNSIVVLDDASTIPPIDIVEQFPGVTLLQSKHHVGPEALVDCFVRQNHFSWYLLQDADDYSSVDRLELQMEAAERYQCEMVGTQEFRVNQHGDLTNLNIYPSNVSLSMRAFPGHLILHATSLFSHSLFNRVNGFRADLRYSADTEFHYRSALEGLVINIPYAAYVRRIRPGSLTQAPWTGTGSPAREVERTKIMHEMALGMEMQVRGLLPSTRSTHPHEIFPFKHLIGPNFLKKSHGGRKIK